VAEKLASHTNISVAYSNKCKCLGNRVVPVSSERFIIGEAVLSVCPVGIQQ